MAGVIAPSPCNARPHASGQAQCAAKHDGWCCRAGRMVGAAWTGDSRGLILGWECASQLGELRLTRPAPSLDAQLWPLQLPELPATLGAGTHRAVQPSIRHTIR